MTTPTFPAPPDYTTYSKAQLQAAQASLQSYLAAASYKPALLNLAPRLDLANKIIERLSERLYDRVAKSPASFPGWSIIQGSWRRKISSPAQAYIHLVKNGPLDHDAFLAATRVSISALKSALSTALSLSPQAADNLLEATLTTDGTLARSQSPPTLSYDSDSIQTFQPSPPLHELSQT